MAKDFCCLFCRAQRGELVFAQCKDYYLGTAHIVDYVRCAQCHLLQQFPRPSDTRSLYDDYPIHAAKSPLFKLLRRVVMSDIYFSPAKNTSLTLLDYGCGDGGFLETLLGRRDLRLIGYEPGARQAAHVQATLDIPVHSSEQSLLDAEEGKVDVLTLHMVLEHLLRPETIFENAWRLLKPEGTMYVVVPNAESFEARMFGKKWHNLDPPRHISFPDRPHLQEWASRYGFELVRNRYAAFPNGFAGSLATVIAGRFRYGLFAACLPLGLLFSRLVPSGARAYWLKKR